jgi:hypothetical protein
MLGDEWDVSIVAHEQRYGRREWPLQDATGLYEHQLRELYAADTDQISFHWAYPT